MWKNRIVGLLGLFILITPFLGFSVGTHRMIMIVVGAIIAILGFWSSMGGSRNHAMSGSGSYNQGSSQPM